MAQILSNLVNWYGHKFIAGMTQNGKTYLALRIMGGWLKGPVLFFNPQNVSVGNGFINADSSSSVKVFLSALRSGKKINYVPSDLQKPSEKELEALVNLLREHWRGTNLLFCIDECEDYAREGDRKSPVLFIARRGLGREIQGLFISQSPADVSKIVLRQSEYHIVFKINDYDREYFTHKKMPGERIEEILRKAPPHNFVVYHANEINGPYMV